jgi:peptide/nickel transport system permease protein
MSAPPEGSARTPGFLARGWDSDLGYAFRNSPVTIAASVVAFVLIGAAFLAPLIATQDPFDPTALDLMDGFTPPGEAAAVCGAEERAAVGPRTREIACFGSPLFFSRRSPAACMSAKRKAR